MDYDRVTFAGRRLDIFFLLSLCDSLILLGKNGSFTRTSEGQEKKRNKARATQWKATQSGTSKETRTNKAERPYLSTTWDMHLGRWLGDAAATPHGGCSAPAHRLRVPRSPLRYFHPLPPPFALSLFLRPTTGFFLHLGSARQSVPGVCTHSAQRPPCPTLLFAGSRPRESSYVVSSCRVASSRWRTFADAPRFLRLFSGGDTGRRLGAENAKEKKTAS